MATHEVDSSQPATDAAQPQRQPGSRRAPNAQLLQLRVTPCPSARLRHRLAL